MIQSVQSMCPGSQEWKSWEAGNSIKRVHMRRLVLVIGFLCLSLGVVLAQTGGTITGEVKDQSGAVVPNVCITATNTATNVARNTQTNTSGIYSFPGLVPGRYQVKASAGGFQTSVTNDIELQVQQTARVDFALTLGAATQTVEVAANAALLATENATVGTVIDGARIMELPLNGRNFFSLVALSPNVTYGFTAAAQASGRLGGGGKSVSHVGAQRDQAEEIAAVQRQLHDARSIDHRADRSVFRGQQSRVGSDLDRLRGCSQGQGEIDPGRLLNLELDVVRHGGLEAPRRGFHLVPSRNQTGEAVNPRSIGLRVSRHIGRRIGGRDAHIWDHRTALVFHFTGDGATGLGQYHAERQAQKPNDQH